MARIRWEPTRELSSLQGEMGQLLNSFFGEGAGTGGGSPPARRWVPAMDLVEAEDHFLLMADLPGLSEQDVRIEVEDDLLTISGERKLESDAGKAGYYRIERAFGEFSRSLTLPEGVDPQSVSADFDAGVLVVRIPKPEQRKPRRVSIGVGRRPGAIEGDESAR